MTERSAASENPGATADASEDHLGRIARGGAVNVFGGVASGLLQLAAVVVVTNLFAVDEAGAFFALSSIFLIVVSGCTLGVDTGLIRAVPRFLDQGRGDLVKQVFRIAALPVIITSAATTMIALGITELWTRSAAQDVSGGTALAMVLAISLPAAALLDVGLAGTRAFGTMFPSVLVDKIGRSALQVVGVALAGLLGGGLLALGVAWALPYIAAAGVAAVVLWRRMRSAIGAPTPVDRSTRRCVSRDFWSFTWPRAVARLLQITLMRIDVVLVAALSGVREAAIYAGASRLLVVGTVGVSAIQQALQPSLSSVLVGGRHGDVVRLYRMATSWNVASAWPIFLLLLAAGPLALGFLGPAYVEGAAGLALLCVAMLFATWAGPVDIVVLMAGKSRWSLGNAAAALATNIALSLMLVPAYGVVGAAIAWAAATVIRNLLPLLQVRRLLGIGAGSRASFLVGGAAILLIGLPVGAVGRVTGYEPLPTVVTAAMGAIGYVLVLWSMRRALRLDLFWALARRRNARNGRALTGAAA